MNNLFLILKFWKCDVMAYKYIAKHADLIVDSYWHLQQGGRLLNKLNDHTQCFEHIKGKFSGRIIFARNIINVSSKYYHGAIKKSKINYNFT